MLSPLSHCAGQRSRGPPTDLGHDRHCLKARILKLAVAVGRDGLQPRRCSSETSNSAPAHIVPLLVCPAPNLHSSCEPCKGLQYLEPPTSCINRISIEMQFYLPRYQPFRLRPIAFSRTEFSNSLRLIPTFQCSFRDLPAWLYNAIHWRLIYLAAQLQSLQKRKPDV